MPNIFRPVFEPPDGTVAQSAVGRLAGARGLDLRLFRLEQHEVVEIDGRVERLMVVSRGSPTVSGQAGPRHLAPGDVWTWPEARPGTLTNVTPEPVEVLILASLPAGPAGAPRERAARRRRTAHPRG